MLLTQGILLTTMFIRADGKHPDEQLCLCGPTHKVLERKDSLQEPIVLVNSSILLVRVLATNCANSVSVA